MSKSILIFGVSDSRHVYNYINIVLKDINDYNDITIFNVARVDDTPQEFAEYYRQRGITILNPRKLFGFLKGPAKSAYNFIERTLALKRALRKKQYDYAIIHYCSWQSMRWVSMFNNNFKHIIPVFWGGDVLRSSKVNAPYFRHVYSSSDCIVLPNINSMEVFDEKTGHVFNDKVVLIQFPQKMVSSFLEAEQTMPSKDVVKTKFGFPKDKLIVICGHTATRAERFEQIIGQLCKLPIDIKEKCFFVFMMTYAPEEYRTYQMEIEESIKSNGIPGCVLKEYLNYNDMQELHAVSDIHITNIKTDALSCFLQEQMLSGSVLLYGKWLKYYDIETPNFYAVPFDDITKMSSQLEEIVSNFEHYKQLSSINRNGIINLASEEVIIKEWNDILKF